MRHLFASIGVLLVIMLFVGLCISPLLFFGIVFSLVGLGLLSVFYLHLLDGYDMFFSRKGDKNVKPKS